MQVEVWREEYKCEKSGISVSSSVSISCENKCDCFLSEIPLGSAVKSEVILLIPTTARLDFRVIHHSASHLCVGFAYSLSFYRSWRRRRRRFIVNMLL